MHFVTLPKPFAATDCVAQVRDRIPSPLAAAAVHTPPPARPRQPRWLRPVYRAPRSASREMRSFATIGLICTLLFMLAYDFAQSLGSRRLLRN